MMSSGFSCIQVYFVTGDFSYSQTLGLDLSAIFRWTENAYNAINNGQKLPQQQQQQQQQPQHQQQLQQRHRTWLQVCEYSY